MVYKIVSNYKKEDLWEISIFKYNLNHQEFLTYCNNNNGETPIKNIYPAERK